MNSFVGDEDTAHIKKKTESSTTHQHIFDFKWTVTKTIKFTMLVISD